MTAGADYPEHMGDEDIRWKQRYRNYERSLVNLREALETVNPSRLEKQGTVKAFELAYELAWKTLQDYLRETGITDAVGPKGVIRRAFHEGIISGGDDWNEMHIARNRAVHLYDEERADQIVAQIRQTFIVCFEALNETLRDAHDAS